MHMTVRTHTTPMKKQAVSKRIPPTLTEIRPVILRITEEYGVTNVRIFGSFARGEQRVRSDVDLLVDLPKKMSLWGLAGLKNSLEDALGRKVDLVQAHLVKPALKKYILADARPL
jgi:uncharacterized protein